MPNDLTDAEIARLKELLLKHGYETGVFTISTAVLRDLIEALEEARGLRDTYIREREEDLENAIGWARRERERAEYAESAAAAMREAGLDVIEAGKTTAIYGPACVAAREKMIAALSSDAGRLCGAGAKVRSE